MKKHLRYAAVLAMVVVLVSGCASFGVWSSAAQKVVDFICHPTEAQMAEAAKWLAAVDAIQAGASVFFSAADIIKASSVMTVIQAGGCFVLAEVEAALNLLSNMQATQAEIKGLKGLGKSSHQEFPALWEAINRK